MKSLIRWVILFLAGSFWLVEDWVRRSLGLSSQDNCLTWAARNFDYRRGDGLLWHRTVIDSPWEFPHFAIIKGARQADRDFVEILEYVPVARDPNLVFPKRKFVGRVKKTRLVSI